eukprot:514023-Alexandrium_andersonii.AAC.1
MGWNSYGPNEPCGQVGSAPTLSCAMLRSGAKRPTAALRAAPQGWVSHLGKSLICWQIPGPMEIPHLF